MSVKTFPQTPSAREYRATASPHGLLHRIGYRLLATVTLIVLIVSGLPVILLFLFTAVPFWIAALLGLADVGIIFLLLRSERTPLMLITAALGWIAVAALAVFLSQAYASTPPITDVEGRVIPGSIASLEAVELNGSQQWVTIRGQSTALPVLLFLAGGPGGSELVMTRRYLGELEQHFIVVNWDQPGTGKSYNAVDFDALTPERIVSDAHALIQHLRERFDEDRIYLFGESWGSILGVWLVQQYPELFHAFISTGQMVDPVENDVIGYEMAIDLLTEQGRLDDAQALVRNGPPPYASDVLIGNFGAINNVLNDYMHARAHGEGTNHNLMLDSLAAPEYGLLDKVYWLLGLAQTFTTVYPQLYEVDFRAQVASLDVPVYVIQGRWDVNAVGSLLEVWFEQLEAPHKELIWFENSAHTPMWDEPAHFVDVIVDRLLQ